VATPLYSDQLQDLQAAQQSVQAEMRNLILAYRDQASLAVVNYVMEQVRLTCTYHYPQQFLRLGAGEQTKFMQFVRRVAQTLGQELKKLSLSADENPWLQLEQAFGPSLAAAEGQLQRLYESLELGSQQQDRSQHLTPLRLLEMELTDPALRHLRAQIQVLSGRLGRLQHQLQVVQEKQVVAQATARWAEVWHAVDQDSTATPEAESKSH
jgi:hypothetical protein